MPKSALKVKKIAKAAKLPEKKNNAAGFDLYITEIETISVTSGEPITTSKRLTCHPGTVYAARTGIAIEMPSDTYGLLKPRSGVSYKHGLMVGAGVIDNDYRGEIKIVFTVTNATPVKEGDRIAQLLLLPSSGIDKIKEVEELSETGRGADGFGSTGK